MTSCPRCHPDSIYLFYPKSRQVFLLTLLRAMKLNEGPFIMTVQWRLQRCYFRIVYGLCRGTDLMGLHQTWPFMPQKILCCKNLEGSDDHEKPPNRETISQVSPNKRLLKSRVSDIVPMRRISSRQLFMKSSCVQLAVTISGAKRISCYSIGLTHV